MEHVPNSTAEELIKRAEADQAMRVEAQYAKDKWDQSIDDDNESYLKQAVSTNGWPTISLVGAEASNAAWVIVQHSTDIDFMDHCLNLMKACGEDDVKLANIAYLEDRVNMYTGEPQRYGTQWKKIDGYLVLYTITDAAMVEERRAAMGLTTLEEDSLILFGINKVF